MPDFSKGGNNNQSATNKANGFGDINGFNDAFSLSNNVNSDGIIGANNNSSVNYNNISSLFNTGSINNDMTAQNNLTNNLKAQPQQIETALEFLDKRIQEMKVGFSRGILNDDFPLESLDPLKSS